MDPRVVRMSDSLWDELTDEAASRDLSTAEYVRKLLEQRHPADPNTQPNTDSEPEPNTSNTGPNTPDAPNTQPNTEPDTMTRDDALIEQLEEHDDRIQQLEERLDTLTAATSDSESAEESTPGSEDQDTPAQESPPHGDPLDRDGFIDRADEAGRRVTIDWDQTDYHGNADDEITVQSAIAQFSYPDLTTPDQLRSQPNRDPSFDDRAQFLHTVLQQVDFVDVPGNPTGAYRVTADFDGDL